MAVVGNRKQLMSLLLLYVITSAVIPPCAEAQVTCSAIILTFSPCMGYVLNGGEISQECCGCLKTIVDTLKTKQDRQIACQCMKDGFSQVTDEQLKRAQTIPEYCKVPLPFQISRTAFDTAKVFHYYDHPNVDLNKTPTPEAEIAQHVDATMASTEVTPEKPRYGSWMLVTKKKKSASMINAHHQNKKLTTTMPRRENQFNALADNHNSGEPPKNQRNSDKGKSKAGNGQRQKVLSPWAEAQVSCDDIYKQLSPCSGYVKTGGAVPADCCPALKTMVNGLKTKLDRQSGCQCIKDGVAKATPDQLKRAQGLPGYCKVPFPFKIGPDVDCSAVPKRI
nr:non-specific lipid-transfer protein 1-like [Ipomoea batatas]